MAAAAKAATEVLIGKPFVAEQQIKLPDRNGSESVRVQSASLVSSGSLAIAISHCESGLGLDLTRGLEIWTCVQWQDDLRCGKAERGDALNSWLQLQAGMGVGRFESTGDICVSRFARELLHQNLRSLVPADRSLNLEVIFPRGFELAERTSNKAFGVVDGLALIGTQSETNVSASPEQVKEIVVQLKERCADSNFDGRLAFVIGENGMDLALSLGIPARSLLKVGNWIGPLLVAAAEEGVEKLLVFGHHGKLVKLAGGIFHTHNHLADGRIEILTALAVTQGLPLAHIQELVDANSVDQAFLMLEGKDPYVAEKLWNSLGKAVEDRSATYVARYGSWHMSIGAALFDRQRQLRWSGPLGKNFLKSWEVNLATD